MPHAAMQVLGITAGVCIVSWLTSYVALDWLSTSAPVLPELGGANALAVATLGATLMMTRSPASAVSAERGHGHRSIRGCECLSRQMLGF